ncbi:MAG TPA: N-acetylmuramoyl-L-alanine amidase [Chthonomonadaceae bacterium]|nr:N-acetylmuramoyl-L-alanine amidase [Chthonomonadaceae bacterium]
MVLNPRNVPARIARSRGFIRVSTLRSLAGCVALALATGPLYAQSANPAAQADLAAVHFWTAGHTVPLRVAARSNGQESYVPLTALDAVGAQFRLVSNANAAHVTAKNGREGDIAITQIKGFPMLALSELAKVLDASVESTVTNHAAGAPRHGADTVYLLAHVTEARVDRGTIHVRTSFPVPFHARMFAETNPVRGYVDCDGATVPDAFRPAPSPAGERMVTRLRAGQNSPTTARIVVELADGSAMRIGDSDQGLTEAVASVYSKSGRMPDGIARGSQGGLAPPAPNPVGGQADNRGAGQGATVDPGSAAAGLAVDASQAAPAAGAPKSAARAAGQPIEVRALNVFLDSATELRFDVATAGKVRPIVRYTPGSTAMQVDIPNSRLALPDGEDPERRLQHPLIAGIRLETLQGSGPPVTRMTLDTSRSLGYSLNVSQGSFSLELRLPRNATGVLADKLIVVDAGHGGAASGATCAGVCEKNCTLGIAMKLRAELEALGARVVMTRTQDVDVSLTDRSRMGNEIGADLFISIHNDSNGRDNSASGTSTYFHNSDPSSRALAACVQRSVMAVTGLPSRGILSDTVMYNSGFAVLRGSRMPAVLCEVAYINNQNDRRKLCDPQFQQRVAMAMCDGLRAYVEGRPGRSASTARPAKDRGGDADDSAVNHNGV